MSDIYIRIVARIQRELSENGLPAEQAAKVSAQTVDVLSAELGGKSVYLPRRTPWYSLSARNRAIREAFDGRNLQEVCRRFGVSPRTVYRACKK